MGTYNGGSTIITGRHMGRTEGDWMFTGKSLFGGDGFKDAAEFQKYCDLLGRMRAFADNYEASRSHPTAKEQVEGMIVAAMIDVGRIEFGKDERLLAVIRKSQGWPESFLADLAAERSAPALQ